MTTDEELQRIRQTLLEFDQRISALERLFKEKGEDIKEAKPVSIGEFLATMNPKTDIERTLVIAYYLEVNDGVSPFNKKEIEGAFKRAKEPSPKNINLCVYKNIQYTFLMESGQKKANLKAWSLTRKGMEFVEQKLKKE